MNDEFWETGRAARAETPHAPGQSVGCSCFSERSLEQSMMSEQSIEQGRVHSVSSPLHHEDTINREIREGDKR